MFAIFLLLVPTHIYSVLVFLKSINNEIAHPHTDQCTAAFQKFNLSKLFLNTQKYQINIKFCEEI